MPTVSITPAHKGGGTDTFMRTLFELTRGEGEAAPLNIDVVTLAPEGTPLVPPGTRTYFVRSKMLNALLYAFREGTNPIANPILFALTTGALALRALGPALRGRYDAIYGIGGPIAASAAAVVARVARRPSVAHFHWAYRFAAKGRLMRAAARIFYECFTLVIGNSRLLAEDARAVGVRRARLEWVYNWADDEKFHPLAERDAVRARWELPRDAFVFLFAGRFDGGKHVDRLIEVLKRQRYDAIFLFAGDGPLRDELLALRTTNDVRVLGTRPPEDLVELHNAADVLLWGSVDVDYPGLVVMEAMASGLPVVTSNESMNPLYPGVAVDADMLGGPPLTRHYAPTSEGIDTAIRETIARRGELAALRPAARAFARERFGAANLDWFLTLMRSVATP